MRPHVCEHTQRDVLLSDTLSFLFIWSRTEQHVVTTNDMLIRTRIRETNSILLSLFLYFFLSLCLSFCLSLFFLLCLSVCASVRLSFSLSFSFVSCSLLRVFLLFLPLAVRFFFSSQFSRAAGQVRRVVRLRRVRHPWHIAGDLFRRSPRVARVIVSSRPLA